MIIWMSDGYCPLDYMINLCYYPVVYNHPVPSSYPLYALRIRYDNQAGTASTFDGFTGQVGEM
jgi:hypothetical protein